MYLTYAFRVQCVYCELPAAAVVFMSPCAPFALRVCMFSYAVAISACARIPAGIASVEVVLLRPLVLVLDLHSYLYYYAYLYYY